VIVIKDVIKDVLGVVIKTVIVAHGIVIKTEDHVVAALTERTIVTARRGVGTATVVIVARDLVTAPPEVSTSENFSPKIFALTTSVTFYNILRA
jgi:hypothetical protein